MYWSSISKLATVICDSCSWLKSLTTIVMGPELLPVEHVIWFCSQGPYHYWNHQ
jgi:hypothetical protein